jgi:hypothetical protein
MDGETWLSPAQTHLQAVGTFAVADAGSWQHHAAPVVIGPGAEGWCVWTLAVCVVFGGKDAGQQVTDLQTAVVNLCCMAESPDTPMFDRAMQHRLVQR